MWIGLRQESISQEDTAATTAIDPRDSLLSLPDGEAVLRLISEQEKITVSTTGDVAALSGPLALTLYRVLQECITNILKYATEGSATIRLEVNP